MTPDTILLEPPTRPFDEANGLDVAVASGQTPVEFGSGIDAGGAMTGSVPVHNQRPEQRRAAPSARAKDGAPYLTSLRDLEANVGETLRFSSPGSHLEMGARGPLYFSLAALSDAIVSDQAADWLETASVLKRDAIRLRNSSSLGRHASVLLTLADALSFTLPSDPTVEADARDGLRRGLSVLTQPYVSTEDEKALMMDLLSRGWNIAPAFGEGRFAD